MILIAASGCDNVDWTPPTFELVPPPSREPEEVEVQVEPPEPDLGLPEGPVLYMGRREGDRVRVTPVAEFRGDTLLPIAPIGSEGVQAFADRHAFPGQELALFAEGVQVGHMTVDSVTTDDYLCTRRPGASGLAQMLPTAGAATHFLALDSREAPESGFGPYAPSEYTYQQGNASISLSAQVIPEVGARWPQQQWLNYRADMRAFAPADGPNLPFAATFLYRDQATVGPADSTGYVIFVMGEQATDGSFRRSHTWYRQVGSDGKGVPLFFEHLDWDRDGSPEVLLEVLGESRRWTAVLAREGGEWVNVFEDPCGAAPSSDGA